ncbi:hypothetical protein Shyhy02_02860 [Streptomyces hygroscopicus subsp. hygroscopicus]|nr:hypothetical protein Shyhy02_02860 [Streptomyces hygroscopicus subsp. hygroscopicus]
MSRNAEPVGPLGRGLRVRPGTGPPRHRAAPAQTRPGTGPPPDLMRARDGPEGPGSSQERAEVNPGSDRERAEVNPGPGRARAEGGPRTGRGVTGGDPAVTGGGQAGATGRGGPLEEWSAAA